MHRYAFIGLENVMAGLVALLAFVLPISTAATNAVLVLCLCAWMGGSFLMHGLLRQFGMLCREPTTLAVSVLMGAFLIASFYSIAPWIDIKISLGKTIKWFALPCLILMIRSSGRRTWVINAFLGSMMLTLLLAMLKVYGGFSIWSVPFTDACVFKDHIFTNLMMSFSAFLLAHKACNASHRGWRVLYVLLCVASIYYVLCMSNGRSGYVLLGVLWIVFCMQKQQRQQRMFGILSLIVLVMLAGLYSSTFQWRVLQVFYTMPIVQTVESYKDLSIEERLSYVRSAWTLVKIHPWLGYGTGSVETAHMHYLARDSAQGTLMKTRNPHNEYLNIALQCGLLGLGALVGFFYMLYKRVFGLVSPEKQYAQGLIAMMIVGCMGNSWLMDFSSAYLFMICLAACFAAMPAPLQAIRRA